MNAISIEQAREIANDAARKAWQGEVDSNIVDFLSSDFLEAEGCWFFFLASDLDKPILPGDLSLRRVFAVTKSGQCNLVDDFRENREKMDDYLQVFSMFGLGEKEKTDKLLQKFFKKYPIK